MAGIKKCKRCLRTWTWNGNQKLCHECNQNDRLKKENSELENQNEKMLDALIDIYGDYDETELSEIPPSIRNAWFLCHSILEKKRKTKGEGQ